MGTLTIYTQFYSHLLQSFAGDVFFCGPSFCEVRCERAAVDAGALAKLLEDIALLRHPIYGPSPKMTDMARALRQTDIHENNVQALSRYLHEHDTLHLEGYAAFRMPEYHEKLDMMSYCVIKKLRLAKQL